MLRFIRAIKLTAAVLIAVFVLAGASTESRAQTGRVRLHIVKAGFIVGVGAGSGVLIYHGQRIPLSVSGIGLGSLGVAAVDLVGTAYNLQRPGLIAGTLRGQVPAAFSSAADRWRGCRTKMASFSSCRGSRLAFRCPWALAA